MYIISMSMYTCILYLCLYMHVYYLSYFDRPSGEKERKSEKGDGTRQNGEEASSACLSCTVRYAAIFPNPSRTEISPHRTTRSAQDP